jgi:endogenous inhibitor of DNA gyrase (YacG/DUF329 family)
VTSDITYPYTDGYGYYWYDSSGFRQTVTTEAGSKSILSPCFICGKPTDRVDIDYHGIFCNSEACNKQIDDDLRRINEAAQNEADSPTV